MKRFYLFTLVIIILVACGGEQRSLLATPPPMSKLAFPNAVGFGANTIGGRGGQVIAVTNLNNSGAGSLRDALTKNFPRIICFRVSGTITLSSHIIIDNPYFTILGQTSPNGIVLKGAGIKVRTHDGIIRGLMIRLGNEPTGAPFESRTGIIINSDGAPDPYNIMIDHVSVYSSTDELASIYGGARNVTISNSIFAEALNCAGHPQGCHAYGIVIADGAKNITFYKNLVANNKWRNPAVYGDANGIEITNNLFHSWGTGSITVHGGAGGASYINILGNYTKPTSCSSVKGVLIVSNVNPQSKVYSDDWGNTSGSSPLINSIKVSVPAFIGSGIIPVTKEQAYQDVLANSGARNDVTDQRIKNNVINGLLPNGKCYIDSVNEVGGWANIINVPYPADSDSDGLPDSFEGAVNLNPADICPSGYACIEEYANSLYGTTPVPVTFTSAPSITPTRTPTPSRTPTVTRTPILPVTVTHTSISPTPTANCVEALNVWVCDKKP